MTADTYRSALQRAGDARERQTIAIRDPMAQNSICIHGVNNKPLVTIKPDGLLEYREGYTPDAAAKIFWEAIANGHPVRELVHLRAECERLRGELTSLTVHLRVGLRKVRTRASRMGTTVAHSSQFADALRCAANMIEEVTSRVPPAPEQTKESGE